MKTFKILMTHYVQHLDAHYECTITMYTTDINTSLKWLEKD
jgi:hypothetical protein